VGRALTEKDKCVQAWRPGEERWQNGFLYQCRLSYWVAPFAYVRITAVRRERLDSITKEDAHREGCSSMGACRKAFEKIYGFWDPDAGVWVVEFELA